MNSKTFGKLDNLLGKLTTARHEARQLSERFTEALQAHDGAEIERRRAELDKVCKRIHKLETAIMAI